MTPVFAFEGFTNVQVTSTITFRPRTSMREFHKCLFYARIGLVAHGAQRV